ncbi:MAG: histidine phosphotransferase family protein [Halocynthiibacter sp.]
MTDTQPNLAALLGSRICHDLISPLGAIGNGVELLAMQGGTEGPELALISESVESANARIRFFRIVYGTASPEQHVARREILSVLADYEKSARVKIVWDVAGDPTRRLTKLAFLLLQCLEVAMPHGGKVTITCPAGRWQVQGVGQKLLINPDLWEVLSNPKSGYELRPSEVQFALVPLSVAELGRSLKSEISKAGIITSF